MKIKTERIARFVMCVVAGGIMVGLGISGTTYLGEELGLPVALSFTAFILGMYLASWFIWQGLKGLKYEQ